MRGTRLAVAGAIAVFVLAGKATSKTCDNGYRCHPPQDCCVQGCCAGAHTLHTPILPSGGGYVPTNVLSTVFWNHWFFWSLLALLLLSCSGGCSLWRRRHELDLLGCQGCAPGEDQDAQSDRDSTASCYPPPQYSRCNSFSQPPPYSEVTSKPDLYPLVISYNDNTANKGGSYLMVQYLRHYFLRPAGGSLSHASTAESLSSAFVCAVAPPEALAGAPPRYVSVADGSQATALPPAPPPLPPPGAAAAAAAVGHRPLPSSASLPSVCSLSSSRLSSRSGSRACSRTCSSRTGSRSRAQSYAHSMAVGEWSSSGSVSVSVQALQGGRGQAQPLLPPRHRGCSSTASEVSSMSVLGSGSPSSPQHELRLLLEQIDSLTAAPPRSGSGSGPSASGAPCPAPRPRPAAWAGVGLGIGGPARRGWMTSRSAPCTPLSPAGQPGQPAVFLQGPDRQDPADASLASSPRQEDPPSPAPSDPPPPLQRPLRPPTASASMSAMASTSSASATRRQEQQDVLGRGQHQSRRLCRPLLQRQSEDEDQDSEGDGPL